MIRKLNKLVLHSLQRLYFPVVPTVGLCRLLEFYFFRFFSSKTYCYCSPVVLSNKEKNYINFEDFTYTKLNCFTVLECKTTKIHYLIVKELQYYIQCIFTFQGKIFNYLENCTISSLCSDMSDSSPPTREGVFSDKEDKSDRCSILDL